MKILGIANDETASACLVINGIIISAASEERFSRIKMDNSWPTKSIEYCLKDAGLDLGEIDKIAYGWSAGFDAEKHFNFYFDRIVDESRFGTEEGLGLIKERFNSEVKSDRKKRNEFIEFVHKNRLESKAVYFDHHECHAYSAFLCSDFSDGLVITSDGRGDFTSFTVSEFSGNTLNVLYRATSFDSFGFFYGRITSLLGYTPHRHEGKITGLAAYGDPKKYIQLMSEMIYVKEGKVYGKGGKYFKASYKDFSDELLSVIKSARPEDIAAAAQLHLEESVKEIVSYYLEKTSKKYLCMSGGVFANVRLNQELLELPEVENVFVQPHMGDGGLALGAAVAAFSMQTNQRPNFQNMFLGPQITIDKKKDVYQKIKEIKTTDIIKEILEKISQGKVVGLAKGKMEFGPRALCNRSIIYHCKDKSVNQWLNKRMKRTEFMPFAPVTAIDFAPECYVGWNHLQKPSFFMTITYNCTEKMKNSCPAVTHLDGTARPQIIQKETDPFMHELLIRAHKEYGLLSLINTSFNVHEEPIVCNDEDAISGLVDDMVDILLLENKLFIKA